MPNIHALCHSKHADICLTTQIIIEKYTIVYKLNGNKHATIGKISILKKKEKFYKTANRKMSFDSFSI
jgi:hypothetical protein